MRPTWKGILLAGLLATACAPADDGTTGDTGAGADGSPETTAFQGTVADMVVEAPGATGEGFQDAERAVDGVRGGGTNAGSADVFSLGYVADVDNYLVLSWGGAWVRNGTGTDFVVFENPFATGDSVFMDLVVVSVSRDGETWVTFPHDYVADDETVYVSDPAAWPGFAGRTPVRYHVESNPVDPFDPEAAGGDPFDLDDLPGDDDETRAIRSEGFRFVKLVTAPSLPNPDTGAPFVRDPASNGADIDGVIARIVEE